MLFMFSVQHYGHDTTLSNMDHASERMGDAMKLFNKILKKETAQRLRCHNHHRGEQEVSSDLKVSKYVTTQQ